MPQADTDSYSSQPEFRRNFVLGILNGSLVNLGLAFIDPFTVLPVFITRLGGSGMLVGLASAVYGTGWFFPQAFAAAAAETRVRVIGIYRAMTVVRVAALMALVAAMFCVDPSRPRMLLAFVIGSLSVAQVAAGISGVPFLEVTSKMFPVETRGRFFAARRFIGGLLGIGAGVVVAVVLGQRTRGLAGDGVIQSVRSVLMHLGWVGLSFPRNYAVLFTIGTALSAVGYAAFCAVRETPSVHLPARRSVRSLFDDGFMLLRHHPNYRLFLAVRVCWQFTAMAFPFYATYAVLHLGFGESAVGVFVSVWIGSAVAANAVWGRLADRSGNRVVLVLTALMSLAPPLLILTAVRSSGGAPPSWRTFGIVALTFLLNGFARSGRFISNMTYLLEFVPQNRRAAYVGFMNTMSAPFLLSPVLGGLLVEAVSFRALFLVAFASAIANVFLSTRLDEPRHARPVVVSENMS